MKESGRIYLRISEQNISEKKIWKKIPKTNFWTNLKNKFETNYNKYFQKKEKKFPERKFQEKNFGKSETKFQK